MKYYTAFLFEGSHEKDHQGNPIHVTHKFMGEQTPEIIDSVIEVIENFIALKRPVLPLPPWPFTKETFFGEGKDVRVLLPKQESAWAFWPELRVLLAAVRPDDFPTFQPHVSTKALRVDSLITSFALMGDGKIIKKWESVR